MFFNSKMNYNNHLFPESFILRGSAMAFALVLLIFLSISCKKGSQDDFTVKSGSFKQSVTETGELEAIKASFVIMPSIDWKYGYQFKIVGMTEHGSIVHKNDSIIKLDASSVYKFIIEKEDVLENELAAAKKQTVQSQNNVQELEAQLKNELSSYDLKKLEVERSKFDTDVKKRIKELEFQQATIKLNKVKRNLELKPKLDAYDEEIQKIKVIQCETDLRDAKETLKSFLIRSPIDGIFQVAVNRFSDNPQNWKIGDTPWEGLILASIPDVTKMRAKSYINEAEIRKVRPGMEVIVRLDALPDVPFKGIITEISKVCLERDNEKVFNISVDISDTDLRLKPGMTVNCEYILYESQKDQFVPNSCLLKEGTHAYVFLKKGSSARKTEVIAGVSNSNHTIVKGDLKPGQKLIPVTEVLNKTNP